MDQRGIPFTSLRRRRRPYTANAKGKNVQLYKENVHNLQLVRDLHQDQFNQLIRQYCHGKEKDVRLLGIQVILEKREPQPKVVEQN